MKDFYDSLEEISDDEAVNNSRLDAIEEEQQRLRRQALMDSIDDENSDNYNEDYYNSNNISDNHNNRANRRNDLLDTIYDGSSNKRRSLNDFTNDDSSKTRKHSRPGDDLSHPKKTKKKKKRKYKKVLIVILIILLIILGLLFWKYQYLDKDTSVNIQTSSSTGLKYTNIALYGLDSREGEMDSGVRSDTIIIASINNLTHKINMISVLRDSFLDIGEGNYNKVNAAFSSGGAKQATEALNKNLDLDIKNYMVINFTALIKAVDALGGIDLDMTSDEVYWLNGYQLETASTCGMESEVFDLPLVDGTQHLNGVQATAYCRIRYVGTDVARTNRQRTVLKAIIKKAFKNPFKTNKMINEAFPYISTNMSYPRFASLGLFAPFYHIGESDSFPFERYPGDRIPGYSGSYVIPNNLSANVVLLHQKLFNDDKYTPSDTVNSISNQIGGAMGY